MLPIFCRITSKNYLDDLKWHHYCISFSGESGVFSQYQDGIKTKTETGDAVGYDGGGILNLGTRGHEFTFTGFNLWDRVLPPEEIKQMANSCMNGIGNVKNWFDFKDAAKSISSMEVLSPSNCTAPPQSEAETESPTSPPARDNTQEGSVHRHHV